MPEAYINSDSRGKWFVIGEGSIEEMNLSGEWIKTKRPVELSP